MMSECVLGAVWTNYELKDLSISLIEVINKFDRIPYALDVLGSKISCYSQEFRFHLIAIQ